MIRLKTDKDLEYIEHAINIGESILSRISRYMITGITPEWLDSKIGFFLLINRSKSSFKGYQGFPANTCISVDTEIIHCIPGNIPFKTGDVVKVDLGVDYKGYKSDQARTYIVDYKPRNPNDFRLLYATKTALDRAVEVAKRGKYIKDISFVIEKTAKEYGVGILKHYGGHGVGFSVHEEPHIPNVVTPNTNIKLEKGMVLAIEPLFVLGNGEPVKNLVNDGIVTDDIGAHFEKTVIIR